MGGIGRRLQSTDQNTGDYEMSITNEQIAAMRADGQITDQEIAIVEGDLIVAKNVVTEARRIIGKVGDILVESTKRQVLKG
jgi:uncharacterized membrane protein YebE (DUF533 family)